MRSQRYALPLLPLLLVPRTGCWTGQWPESNPDNPGWGDDDTTDPTGDDDTTDPTGDDDTTDPGDDDDDTQDACAPTAEGGQAPADTSCMSLEPYATFAPDEVIEWQWTGSAVDPEYNQVMMTPVVVNLTDDNGDGIVDERDTPDVLFNAHFQYNYEDGRLRAISGIDGSDLWTLSDPNYNTRGGTGLAAGDLDGDGLVEIVAITEDGEVMLVQDDGVVSWVTSLGKAFGNGTQPAVADLMGDGDPEIIVGRLILSSDGAVVAEGAHGSANWDDWGPISFAADVDLDHIQEIVTDNAVYEPDGTAKWANGGPEGYPAIGDFDGEGDAEIVVVGSSEVYLYDANDGSTIWGPTEIVGGVAGGAPTVADYDGDGLPEIGVAACASYTVIDTDGSILWSIETEDDSSATTGSSVFDFNGDGVAEVVYADETTLYILEGPTGAVLFEAEEHNSATLWENPVIVDIDHDHSAEIVLASNDRWGMGGVVEWTGITVLGSETNAWFPARGIWNQHAYSITNVEDDGSIPVDPQPPWRAHNSFRRNSLADESMLHLPNLYVHFAEFCLEACPDELFLSVHVANGGLADVGPGLGVSVYREGQGGAAEFLVSGTLPTGLPSGVYSEPLLIALDPDDVAGARLTIAVDSLEAVPQGAHEECHEDDNLFTLEAPSCT